MNETLNHLEMIEIGSHRLMSFSSWEVGTIGHEFFLLKVGAVGDRKFYFHSRARALHV